MSPQPYRGVRYPVADLAAALGESESALCIRMGASGSTQQEYRTKGLTDRVADRWAVTNGYHPANVWRSWNDDGLHPLDRLVPIEEWWAPAWEWAHGYSPPVHRVSSPVHTRSTGSSSSESQACSSTMARPESPSWKAP